MIKAKDLARQLGVSAATISLVLNGKPGISEKTRSRIIKQMIDLGYSDLLTSEALSYTGSAALIQPTAPVHGAAGIHSTAPVYGAAPVHTVAAAQPEHDPKNIALIIFKNNGNMVGRNSFLPLILEEMESVVQAHGYHLVIVNMEKTLLREQLHYITDTPYSGFVIFATEMHEDDMVYFESLNLPFLLLDNYFPTHSISAVTVNNQQGTAMAAKLLYDMGHKKVGYLDSGLFINSFQERRMFALSALAQYGIETEVYTIGYANFRAQEGMARLLSEHPKSELPTAFMADNDLVAVGAMLAIQQAGYKVPDDFSIIGYDNRPICTLVMPDLTTIELPRNTFGAAAMEQIIQNIENGSSTVTNTAIGGNLIVRGSVSKPSKE